MTLKVCPDASKLGRMLFLSQGLPIIMQAERRVLVWLIPPFLSPLLMLLILVVLHNLRLPFFPSMSMKQNLLCYSLVILGLKEGEDDICCTLGT